MSFCTAIREFCGATPRAPRTAGRLDRGDQPVFRDEVTLSGALSDGTDEGTGGREIIIEATTAAGTETAARATTSADGTYSVQVLPRENTTYAARYAGGADNASESGSVAVSVAPVVKAFPSDDEIKRKKTLQVAGVVAPSDAVDAVRLEARTTAGWSVLASGPVGLDGEYALRWSPTNKDKGRYVMRVATSGNDRFAAGSSPTFRVRVR